MPNLIVILFNLLYPVFYVGFHCKDCVCERVWRLKAIEDQISFREYLASNLPTKWSMCSTHDWNAKSHEKWWWLVFASVLWVRPSREIPTKHFVFPICHIWYTLSLPTLFIPTLSTYVKELRVKDCYTHNPLHNPLWFSSTPTSRFPNPWEVDSPNTYYIHFECKVRFCCCCEVLEEAICLVDAIELNCVIRKAREDKA